MSDNSSIGGIRPSVFSSAKTQNHKQFHPLSQADFSLICVQIRDQFFYNSEYVRYISVLQIYQSMLDKFQNDASWDYPTYERQLKKFVINEYEDQIVFFQKKFDNINQTKKVKEIKLKLVLPKS